MTARLASLIELGRAFGDASNDLCILAEGNVSCLGDNESLWVKGSGVQMDGLTKQGLVEVALSPVLKALDEPPASEIAVRELLNCSRCDFSAKMIPSTETFMHAYLLSLPDIEFVGHGHPTPLLSLLSLEDASDLAMKRLFPDEIVLCGPAACYVPYRAPGLPLAVDVKSAVERYVAAWGVPPKTIWLQNHGLITLGKTAKEVLNSALMNVKAARVTLGALQAGKPVRWLTREEILQIHNWQDEHYRQKLLNG